MGLMGQIKVIKPAKKSDTAATQKALESQLGDVSWADGLFPT